ncbi:alpha/beta fold hydrolase [Sporolactobacillus sp. STSJ-5]|uniref:alpha/beta hydrolase n=1 Tax=Sporolactobacillus sp. STSJ-5 TaxID=2965076 RepID=UPI00210268D6|nr:alpha/beta fold hydrolase [Sporolactobacillus sp. STSJ-5]MCQ2009213.1 alpha/beta fold hydrolase [Sporolactobacillus sp. STSJ-5]
MELKRPKPFFLESGPRAVLLLHGFTGNSIDVRQLGRYLNQRGYTCCGPIYSGHGGPPEELLKTGPKEWWQDVCRAVEHLQQTGHTEFAVCGLSLGGVFSLKCGYTFSVKGIIPMCAPAYSAMRDRLVAGTTAYARTYKQYQGKSGEEITVELQEFRRRIPVVLDQLSALIDNVREESHKITAPALIIQAQKDEMINPESAHYYYDSIHSTNKQLKWYENSTHVITLGTEKVQLHKDIYAFLESLDWSVS